MSPVPRYQRLTSLLLVAVAATSCAVFSGGSGQAGARLEEPQATFWASLQALCGKAFEGRVIENQPASDAFENKTLVMHVRECSGDVIRIPFHVGTDRSRTWVVSKSANGLRLKHDHRHEDGKPDSVTQYGGDANASGSAIAQHFPADRFTATMLPASATNVWTIQVIQGNRFAYALRREGTDRRFRVEFDLTRPVAPPPPPWQ